MSEELRTHHHEEHAEDCTCGCHEHEHEHHHHHHHEDGECCGHGHHHHEDGECCGHEHHHHHEDGECCGHEHHHHHHDHGDDCDCGCHEHEHDHHHHHHDHGDDCDCGCHDHDHHEHDHAGHDHGHTYDVPGYKIVETHNHEGATICSFEKETNRAADEVKPAMEKAILQLQAWLDEQGALIGHVKGYIKEAGPTTTFSTTGNELNIEAHAGGGVSIGFASIVFGPGEEVLKDRVIELFANV